MRNWLAGLLLLLLAAPAGAQGKAMETYLFGPADMARLEQSGTELQQGGTYQVWAWAPRGGTVSLTLGGSHLQGQVPGRAAAGDTFDWVRLGTLDAGAGELVKLGRSAAPGAAPVGYLALSLDPNYLPARALELRRVHPLTDAPVTDARQVRARTNNEGINFQPYTDRAAWLRRREELREQILVSAGLWPLPERPPLKPQVYGRLDRDGYSIEKVVLETLPGFYLTGNLYRPAGKTGRQPGILCPHGHWATGRFEEQIQARCIGLARTGGVVFVYDMVGFGDSKPFGHSFTNPALGLLGVNLTGLQLWNSMRGLDFLMALPDVDPARIACTGESGGGTQTFLLCAVDDRVQVAAPVCMVSHTFQGGCECENSPGLRYDTDNVEIAAAFAPKPMILVGATGDWTSKIMTNGYPEIRATYRLLGKEENVSAVIFEAPHNYNKQSREAVYAWFGRYLFGITDPARTREQPYQVEKEATISCWDAEHPRPAGTATPADLQRTLTQAVQEQVARLLAAGAREGSAARDLLRAGLRHELGCALPAREDLLVEEAGTLQRSGFEVRRLLLGRRGRGDRVPALLYLPAGRRPAYATVVVHPAGKAALVTDDGEPAGVLAGLLQTGQAVLAIDLFLTGEHLGLREVPKRATTGHFLTYNRSTLAEQVQDILTAAAYLKSLPGTEGVHLAGLEAAGTACLLARALTDEVSRAAVDGHRFEYTPGLPATDDRYTPGLLRYGGLAAAALLAAPHKLLLHNTGPTLDTTACRRAYERQGAAEDLMVQADPADSADVVAWLTR
jgi:dienelactone hydrolase